MTIRTAISFVAVIALASPLLSADLDEASGIGPIGDVEKVKGGFMFTEGPADDGAGNLFFTDIPANRIYRLDRDGKITVFLEPSKHANGLMFTDGKLLACQMDGQLVSIDRETKQETVLAGQYQGKRFNAPNDLVIDQAGGVYFTDPHFRAPDPLPQGTQAVYYRASDGNVSRIIDDLPAPNGVILSPDEKTLYVIPTGQKQMMAYAVESPGKIGQGRVFCELQQPGGEGNSGGDGLTIDNNGNLYITSRLGLQVFNPQGKLLGTIEFPEQPANVTFGGPDRQTLYVTARTSLYKVKTNATGHVFGK